MSLLTCYRRHTEELCRSIVHLQERESKGDVHSDLRDSVQTNFTGVLQPL